MIKGVKVKKLKKIKDKGGFLMEMLRSDWPEFKKFGQLYVSCCNPGYVKAWHYHKKQTDFFIALKGKVKIVLYDNRKNSKTKNQVNEFITGEKNPMLIIIPPGVLHGFECVGKEPCFVVNCPNKLYNYKKPDEFRLKFNDPSIKYKWKAKKGW